MWLTALFFSTLLGSQVGGIQSKNQKTGVPYVRWPESLIDNEIFLRSIREAKGEIIESDNDTFINDDELSFRNKYKANCRAADGHMVRSKGEMLIDNWLYHNEIAHAYERKLPVMENVLSDFYIPEGKVYIEYWGLEENDKYALRKAKKLEIYHKYKYALIELNDKDVHYLDDVLPKHLLEPKIRID